MVAYPMPEQEYIEYTTKITLAILRSMNLSELEALEQSIEQEI